jgi:hypothetical protein
VTKCDRQARGGEYHCRALLAQWHEPLDLVRVKTAPGHPAELAALFCPCHPAAPVAESSEEPRSRELMESSVYRDHPEVLTPPSSEDYGHEGGYIAAVVTRFGIRPIRSLAELNSMRREQERAIRLEEPAMLIGLPVSFDDKSGARGQVWLDGAGIAPTNDLALFDLRRVSVTPLERLSLT